MPLRGQRVLAIHPIHPHDGTGLQPVKLDKPIRIGMIGLSGNALVSWGSGAHLPYLERSQAYTITALLNTSIESARAARDAFKLPANTKLYDSPEELAKDADVDLVVCNVRVDRHWPLTRPSIEAGKAVFVEWPLGKNLQEARAFVELAQRKGIRTIAGNQARVDPLAHTVREAIEQRLGGLISVHVRANTLFHGYTDTIDYFLDRSVGGNFLTVHLAHLFDYLTSVLGPLEKGFDARFKIGHPEVDLVDEQQRTIRRATKDVPDQVVLQGQLADHAGALFSLQLRGGANFKGDADGLVWTLYGPKGELKITHSSSNLNVGTEFPTTKARFHRFNTDTVEDLAVDQEQPAFFRQLPLPARNIARLYEAFARDDESAGVDFADALRLHEALEDICQAAEKA